MSGLRDGSELETPALAAHLRLGDFERAESHAHRSLTLLGPRMQRDRANNTAQLAQGEAETAAVTAMQVNGGHPRVVRMLRGFGAALHATAPGSPGARA
ncbi:hypothetical protein [Streptomyces smaragdinus]|nr:hypothetical protein [Streptomyces smaragdinus]